MRTAQSPKLHFNSAWATPTRMGWATGAGLLGRYLMITPVSGGPSTWTLRSRAVTACLLDAPAARLVDTRSLPRSMDARAFGTVRQDQEPVWTEDDLFWSAGIRKQWCRQRKLLRRSGRETTKTSWLLRLEVPSGFDENVFEQYAKARRAPGATDAGCRPPRGDQGDRPHACPDGQALRGTARMHASPKFA